MSILTNQELFVVITTQEEPRIFGPFASRRRAALWAQTTDELDPFDFVDIRPLEDPNPEGNLIPTRRAHLSVVDSNDEPARSRPISSRLGRCHHPAEGA